MDRWLWLCPIVALIGAATMLWAFGFSLMAALGVAFLLSCPALIVWTLREARRAFGLRDRLLDEMRGGGRHT